MNLATRLVSFPASPGDPFRPTATPVYQTATFALDPHGLDAPFDYTRSGNPTRAVLEAQIAALEGGARGFAFASGLAALAAVLRLLRAGDEIVADRDLYGGTCRLLAMLASGHGLVTRFVDATDLDAVADAVGPRTRLVLVETFSNPLLREVDVAALARLSHARGALLAVDNSAATPLLRRPLALGADLVVHSATKYLGGHGDVTAGLVVAAGAALGERVYAVQNGEGAVLAPFETFLLLRGMKTLAVRLRQQQRTARAVARLLAGHPGVRAVHYPRTPSGAFATQGGAVVSFAAGSEGHARAFVAALRLLSVCVSFGSVHSTVCLPCAMSHASVEERERRARGLGADLVRLSVGLEDRGDVLADVARGLGGLEAEAQVAGCQAGARP